jgi:hypothetical protein
MITIGFSEDLGSLTKETKEKKRSLETTCSILRHKLTITWHGICYYCIPWAIVLGQVLTFRNQCRIMDPFATHRLLSECPGHQKIQRSAHIEEQSADPSVMFELLCFNFAEPNINIYEQSSGHKRVTFTTILTRAQF